MVDLPPPLWDAPFTASLIEIQRPLPRVGAICRELGLRAPGIVYGCALWANGGCVIVIPRVDAAVSEAEQQAIRRHETAHCNGWPASHPQK